MIPTPCRLESRTSWNSRSVSRSVRAAVGSSRMRIERFVRNALAISAICCSARDSRFTRIRGRMGKPRRRRASSARRRISGLLMRAPVVGSAPRKRFSSTVRPGTRLNSWKTALMPRWRASCTERNWTGRPRSSISPASGRSAPATILMRVDFPAPFSPNRTWTSPGRRSKSTPRSACTPGNHFVTPRRRRTGGAPEVTSGARPVSVSANATRALLVDGEGRPEVGGGERRLVVEGVDVGLVDHVDLRTGVLGVGLLFQDPDRLVDGDPALDDRRVGGSGEDGAALDVLIHARGEVVGEDLDLVRLAGVPERLHRRLRRGRGAHDVVDVRVGLEHVLDELPLNLLAGVAVLRADDLDGALGGRLFEALVAGDHPSRARRAGKPGDLDRLRALRVHLHQILARLGPHLAERDQGLGRRSEERRVGKECRCAWSGCNIRAY